MVSVFSGISVMHTARVPWQHIECSELATTLWAFTESPRQLGWRCHPSVARRCSRGSSRLKAVACDLLYRVENSRNSLLEVHFVSGSLPALHVEARPLRGVF